MRELESANGAEYIYLMMSTIGKSQTKMLPSSQFTFLMTILTAGSTLVSGSGVLGTSRDPIG